MSILDDIVAVKREEVARLSKRSVTAGDLQWAQKAFGARRDFLGALRYPRVGSVALIAEVKKASPSAGVIRADFDPVRIALDYQEAGASCLSVLTDARFFQGSLDFLRRIRREVRLPLLRKDFIIEARQIYESLEWGADAVLLIVAILSDDALRELRELAEAAGLAVLVEVHDEAELQRALKAGATLLGVNNRNLKDFTVDLGTTERLARELAGEPARADKLLVAESGIRNRSDVERLQRAGAQAVLVGETLMREPDVIAASRALIDDSARSTPCAAGSRSAV